MKFNVFDLPTTQPAPEEVFDIKVTLSDESDRLSVWARRKDYVSSKSGTGGRWWVLFELSERGLQRFSGVPTSFPFAATAGGVIKITDNFVKD